MPTSVGLGIETLMQLGSLGEANFKPAKSLTAWEKLQQVCGIAKYSNLDCNQTIKQFGVEGLLLG